jgi:importin-5
VGLETICLAQALECISLVGMAVGRERFRTDAHAVMSYMQQLQVGAARM